MIFTNYTHKSIAQMMHVKLGKVHLSMLLLFLAILMEQEPVIAQDVQFTQFYASNMYVNPAFVGSSHLGRLISHSRYQWPGIEAKYVTTLASFDFYHPRTNSGFGGYALRDWQGQRNLSTNEFALMYSYELPVNERYTLRLGLQGTYVSRYLNYSVLNFPDQFDDNGPLDKSSNEPFGNDKIRYGDVTAGTVLYSKQTWISVAAKHLNRPNQSFYNSGDSRLPVKYSVAGGYKIYLRKKSVYSRNGHIVSLVPSVHYKFQGKSDQLDVGLYYLKNKLITGVWYRGIPLIKKYDHKTQNNESFAVLMGVKLKDFGVSYSYDFVVSKLTRTKPFGAHELNLVYVFPYPKKTKKVRRILPCPDFQ